MKSFSEYLNEANVYGQPWENSFRKAWQDAGKFTSKSFNSLGIKGQEWATVINGKFFKGTIACRRMGNPLTSVGSGNEMYYEMTSVKDNTGKEYIKPRTYFIAHDQVNINVFSKFTKALQSAENDQDIEKALKELGKAKNNR